MTLTEFLAWEEHQTERHEFFDGETFAMVGGTTRHNRVTLNLASRIGTIWTALHAKSLQEA